MQPPKPTQPASSPPTGTPAGASIEQRHAANLERFAAALGASRYWHLEPRTAQPSTAKSSTQPSAASGGFYDTQSGLLYPAPTELAAFLQRHPFAYVRTVQGQTNLATLHTQTWLLWNHETSDSRHSLADGKKLCQEGRWAGLQGWELPSKDTLWAFATAAANPHRKGKDYRLAPWSGSESYSWLTSGGQCYVDTGYWGIDVNSSAAIFACHALWQGASPIQILQDLATRGWRLQSPAGEVFEPSTRFQAQPAAQLLLHCISEGWQLRPDVAGQPLLDPSPYWLHQQLHELDHTPCRLPLLDGAQLADPAKGLWELWGEAPDTLRRFSLVARNPALDLQQRAVAIDFGTSSTVVAMDGSSGQRELLRIGVRDFYEPVQAQHFENPTVLECLDWPAFERAWCSQSQRPALDWNWMRAAHEAQTSLRDNPGDTRVLASILPRLKQWALRSQAAGLHLTDRSGHEIALPAHTERNPVRGQPLSVSPPYPFDPIELYAWYLGMTINWRGRGLFLKYYLSFPVKYPQDVRERVLASFRRGLLRSLPQTLIEQQPQVLNDFEVCNLASEPAAYAAAALPQLGLEPTDAGLFYAVFDFGGGTTDFDFGLLRWANSDEEQRGYERVFEHLGSSGDNFLGGENLLENLVYRSFQGNLDELRKHRIQFTQPLDAPAFAGSEAFLARTQAAQTNTVLLAAHLRPFLEGDQAKLSQCKLELIDPDGQKKSCELSLNADELDAWLQGRIRAGAVAFLAELQRQRSKLPAELASEPLHILLAGNGSRSRHISALFDTQGSAWPELLAQAFGAQAPEIVIHPPLPISDANPHQPTAKTGVALGLLRLAPGENTLTLNQQQQRHQGQAPFGHFVGRLRRGHFEPVLMQNVDYGTWYELGPLQQGVFNLYASASPRAHQSMAEGDAELRKHRLEYPAAAQGAHLYARATGPHKIELTAAPHHTAPDPASNHPSQELHLA